MSQNHAKNLNKLNDGLAALQNLVQESVNKDYKQEKVEIVAEVAERSKQYADTLAQQKASEVESSLLTVIDNKANEFVQRFTDIETKIKTWEQPQIKDRELSGNKINGGMITNFSSRGIVDEASNKVLRVTNDAVVLDTPLQVKTIQSNVTVEGNLTTTGTLRAKKIRVDEVESDTRLQRTTPLTFEAEEGNVAGKGLLWTGDGHTKQFVYQKNSDRFFSSESIDLHKDNTYRISNAVVLSASELGAGVHTSSLRKVGVLQDLKTTGNFSIDEFIFYDAGSSRLGIGTDTPNADLSIMSFDHEFVISSEDETAWQIGSRSNIAVSLVTDNTPRITIGRTGKVDFHSAAHFENIAINASNNDNTVKLNVGGAIVQDGKKFLTGDAAPTNGSFNQGDIVWNQNPQSRGYVGWICIRPGTPGEWKTFGPIS